MDTRESLLAELTDLAARAGVTPDAALLHNALLGIVLVSRMPFRVRQSLLNGILSLPVFGMWKTRLEIDHENCTARPAQCRPDRMRRRWTDGADTSIASLTH